MICQFHKNTLLILFSTLLISGISYFTQLQSIHLEVYGLQNANYLTIKDASIQNTNPNSNNNTTKPATAANIADHENVIERVSDRGIYRIQLRSDESFSSLPKKGFDMQILFLNANSASAQSNNNPVIAGQQQQTNQLVPVNGFDITIYSNNGKVLWQKTNQTINAATAFENVTFANSGPSGGITIQLTNIEPSPVPIGTAIPLGTDKNIDAITGSFPTNNRQIDSVRFTASILK
jgi:hypothetical protein